jgi:hypothetical protein
MNIDSPVRNEVRAKQGGRLRKGRGKGIVGESRNINGN